MESQQPSVGLVRAWSFRIWLLVAALAGFVGTIVNTQDRLQFSSKGVAATITRASDTQKVPTDADWLGGQHDFYVKAVSRDGKESSFTLLLSRPTIETLVDGGQAEIIYVRDNPRRHLMQGEPLPPFGLGWLVFGLASLSVFLYSLQLK